MAGAIGCTGRNEGLLVFLTVLGGGLGVEWRMDTILAFVVWAGLLGLLTYAGWRAGCFLPGWRRVAEWRFLYAGFCA